jgi:para-nitrobenzyl esterase
VPYAFNNLDQASPRAFTPVDRQVAATVSRYWVNFIKTGNPNGDRLPHWAQFDPQSPSIMALGATPSMQPLLNKEKIEFYQQVRAQGGQLSLF